MKRLDTTSNLIALLFGCTFTPMGLFVFVCLTMLAGHPVGLIGAIFVPVGLFALSVYFRSVSGVRKFFKQAQILTGVVSSIGEDPSVVINGYFSLFLVVTDAAGVTYESGRMYAPQAESYMGQQVPVFVTEDTFYVDYKFKHITKGEFFE